MTVVSLISPAKLMVQILNNTMRMEKYLWRIRRNYYTSKMREKGDHCGTCQAKVCKPQACNLTKARKSAIKPWSDHNSFFTTFVLTGLPRLFSRSQLLARRVTTSISEASVE
jgi:hypothetical protein